jgi:hypothetical protein
MADNRTDYRDPHVSTSKDSGGGMPSWLKWALIALAVIAVVWIVAALIPSDNEAAIGTTEPAVVTEEPLVTDDVETEIVPVVPAD